MQDLAKGLKGKHKLKRDKNLSDKSFIPPPPPPPPPPARLSTVANGEGKTGFWTDKRYVAFPLSPPLSPSPGNCVIWSVWNYGISSSMREDLNICRIKKIMLKIIIMTCIQFHAN